MFDGGFSPSIDVAEIAVGGSGKADRILGPDGKLYTQGEAARLGLIIRTACEACRNRKLKCSGTLPEDGGCGRCKSDKMECVYSARAPIGRPKKRKVEEEQDAVSVSPSRSALSSQDGGSAAQKTKLKGKGKERASNSLIARVKSEDSSFSAASPLGGGSSYQPDNFFMPGTPEHSTASHDHSSAVPTPNMFGIYPSSLSTPSMPGAGFEDSRLPSTPVVWSQHHPMAYAVTPSDVMTPPVPISPATSQPRPAPAQSTLAAKMPSLDDLSVAAFLQSLDTLEISSEELMQQQLQRGNLAAATGSAGAAGDGSFAQGAPSEATNADARTIPTSSVGTWAMSSAILQPGLSFAVPADFSWWDLGLNGADFGSAGPSVSGTPSAEPANFSFQAGQIAQADPTLSSAGMVSEQSSRGALLSSAKPRKRRPTFGSDQPWPRGALAGMGQGQIQQAVAATETGLGWSTLPGFEAAARSSASPDGAQASGSSTKSCCSSKANNGKNDSPVDEHVRPEDEGVDSAAKSSCCSSKPTRQATPPTPFPSAAPSCCSGKIASRNEVAETKSCCSSHGPAATSTSGAEAEIEMGPLSTSAAVTGKVKEALDVERRRHAETHAHHPSKVHCVPNPSGKGCTCLCDMSVALLSVKQVLRETDPARTDSRGTATSAPRSASFATDTIQLTLTASQAITAQCACSADCPTCQSDPSTEISASLLVSTALQIYARAVRILREGFAASTANKTDSAEVAAAGGFFGGLDVTIGTYKPSAANAKKIALFAIKLELKDLRRALGKISRMAQSWGSTADVPKSTDDAAQLDNGVDGKGQGMNPIDQLVILKLYRQLTELLKTVEGLEDAA